MAHNALRLRRALSLTTTLLSHTRLTPPSLTPLLPSTSPTPPPPPTRLTHLSPFHSTTHLPSSSSARSSFNDIEKIDPDTILFEGCDYKHWLIVMDFGKDVNQRPPPDQMVNTYVQTCAQVLGSVEEAMKKIYACSTTTYTGFQVEVDEETSKKFEGLPGVTFVLPDSYIDPVNKEYGGDKYMNGTIIPRPPPVQYGRMRRGGRQDGDRPRGPMPNQHGNSAYNQHGSMPGDGRAPMPQGGFRQPQNYPPKQNYGPPVQGERGNPMPNAAPYPSEGRDNYQGGRNNYVHPNQGNYNQGYNTPQGHMTSTRPVDHNGYAPHGQLSSRPGGDGYNQPQGGGYGAYVPSGQMGFSGDNRNFNPQPSAAGGYGQTGVGSFEQSGAGQYGPGLSGSNGQAGYEPAYTPNREHQRFSHTSDERNNTSEHRNYSPAPQNGMNQGRY